MKFHAGILAATTLALGFGCALTMAAADAPLRSGAPAPAFQLASNGGKTINLADSRGQVVLLNFWATWCGPCRKEMPVLEQLHKQYKSKGFAMLGVNVEPDTAGAIGWLKATPVSFPILFDTDSTVSKLYNVQGMPNTVILDRKGNVRYIHRGYKPGDENEYQDQIRALIRE